MNKWVCGRYIDSDGVIYFEQAVSQHDYEIVAGLNVYSNMDDTKEDELFVFVVNASYWIEVRSQTPIDDILQERAANGEDTEKLAKELAFGMFLIFGF